MSDHVLMVMPEELLERLRDRVANGDFPSVNAIVEAALDGDPSTWRLPNQVKAPVATGVLVIDEEPISGAPACRYYKADGSITRCKQPFRWRGSVRCGCPAVDLGGARVVQANLEHE